MTNEELLKETLRLAAEAIGLSIDPAQIVIEHSRDTAHGDYSTNAAMRFSRLAQKKPLDLAKELVSAISSPMLEKVEIAGPGFINFFLKKDALQGVVERIIQE
ncbi:MAG: arginine--tRNA ligase, partial [Candidatus Enteromonas sp.]|nr:arginine--tRNA ligase [Candidatus Enteromonas sp.]